VSFGWAREAQNENVDVPCASLISEQNSAEAFLKIESLYRLFPCRFLITLAPSPDVRKKSR
jgi:hypothetical protein